MMPCGVVWCFVSSCLVSCHLVSSRLVSCRAAVRCGGIRQSKDITPYRIASHQTKPHGTAAQHVHHVVPYHARCCAAQRARHETRQRQNLTPHHMRCDLVPSHAAQRCGRVCCIVSPSCHAAVWLCVLYCLTCMSSLHAAHVIPYRLIPCVVSVPCGDMCMSSLLVGMTGNTTARHHI